jgi:hypothetical protein
MSKTNRVWRRRLRTALAAAGIAVLIAGCSGSGSSSAPAKVGASGDTAPTPKQVRTPSP